MCGLFAGILVCVSQCYAVDVFFVLVKNVIIYKYLLLQELYYDDDSVGPESGELERLTHQIKDKVDEVEEMVRRSIVEKTDTTQGKNEQDRYKYVLGSFYCHYR